MHEKERTMGCNPLAEIVWVLLVFGHFPKTIWGPFAVGVVVGLIIGLVKGDWGLMGLSCVVGLVAGLMFELIVSIISRRRR